MQRPDGSYGFGGTRRPLSADGGLTIDLSSGGLQAEKWAEPTLFFDTSIPRKVAVIATEEGTPEPPVRVELTTRKKVPAGDHELAFTLTYFNGKEWQIASTSALLHIPSWYKRHEAQLWGVGIIVAAAAIVVSALAAG